MTLANLLSQISGLPLALNTRARLMGYAAIVYLNQGSWLGLGIDARTLARLRAEFAQFGIDPDGLKP